MDKIYFSLGPVQSFIAMAKKTKDLWSGSFLLSYLSGCAMHEIERLGGNIKIPAISNDPLYNYIANDEEKELEIGSLPNLFLAEPNGEDPFELARAAEQRIIDEWLKIADFVWDTYLEGLQDLGNNTKEIWDNQVNTFWDINWIIGPKGTNINMLKNWRNYSIPDQEGDKCMLMGDWQEISGYTRSINRDDQDTFWEKVRQEVDQSNLSESERICAIALVKRLFTEVAADLNIPLVDNAWPSTSYISALPWLIKAKTVEDELIENFVTTVEETNIITNPFRNKFYSSINSLNDRPNNKFFEIASDILYLTGEEFDNEENKEEINQIKQAKNLITNEIGPLSNYFAVMAMDGDHLGRLKHKTENPDKLSKALSEFAEYVIKTVPKHDGFLIYAGGDDVLAFFPIDKVLNCSLELANRFTEIIEDKLNKPNITMSAGIVFSHHKDPLRNTLSRAQEVLDDIAKEENGRGSIAINILKSGTLNSSYVTTWEHLTGDNQDKLTQILEFLKEDENILSHSFIYQSQEMIQKISNAIVWNPGEVYEIPNDLDLEKLLFSEAKDTRKPKNSNDAKLRELITLIAQLMRQYRRDEEKNSINTGKISIDILKMINFFDKEEIIQ